MSTARERIIAALAVPSKDYLARQIAKLIVDNRLHADAIIRLQNRVAALEKVARERDEA